MSDSDFVPNSAHRFAAFRQLMLGLHNAQKRMERASADSARITEALEAVFDPETMFVRRSESVKGTGKGKKILTIHASHPYLMVVRQPVDDDVNAD